MARECPYSERWRKKENVFKTTEQGDDVKLTRFEQTDKGAVMSFAETNPMEAAVEVGRFLESAGLAREEGTDTQAIWGSGSKVGRALGGAFAKRRKYNVTIDGSDPVTVVVESAMSGWGGGAIGASKEKKNRREMAEQLRGHFEARSGS